MVMGSDDESPDVSPSKTTNEDSPEKFDVISPVKIADPAEDGPDEETPLK